MRGFVVELLFVLVLKVVVEVAVVVVFAVVVAHGSGNLVAAVGGGAGYNTLGWLLEWI